MPYQPNVVDISGQLRAQGMLGASQTYNQGMQQFAQSYTAMKAKKEADDELLAKARSTENFIKSHADQFGGEESVKMLTATSPNETPRAKYARLGQAVQDMVVGNKAQTDQAQAAEMQQRAKFQQQQVAQMQATQKRQDAMRAQLKAALAARQQQQGQGVPTMNPDGSPMPQPPPTMQDRALDIYAATGEPPGSNEITGMMNADSRDQVGAERDLARTQIAAANDATKRAQLAAKDSAPVWSDIPGMQGSKVANINGQPVVVHPPVPKDRYEAMVDDLSALKPEEGGISKTKAAAVKKQLIAASIAGKQDAMIQMIASSNPGLAAKMMQQRQAQMDSIWNGGEAPAPTADVPPAGSATVKIQTPNGTVMNIPPDKLQQALQMGAKRIQ